MLVYYSTLLGGVPGPNVYNNIQSSEFIKTHYPSFTISTKYKQHRHPGNGHNPSSPQCQMSLCVLLYIPQHSLQAPPTTTPPTVPSSDATPPSISQQCADSTRHTHFEQYTATLSSTRTRCVIYRINYCPPTEKKA